MNYQIQTLNAISPAIYTQLGEHYHVSDHAEQPDAILVRSASMHDLPLAPSVLCIARAGAGTNNIPIDACTQAGVEEHIPCHKGAYTGKSGITRDRTGKPWYYRNLKR